MLVCLLRTLCSERGQGLFSVCGLSVVINLILFKPETELLLCEVIPKEEIPQPKQCPCTNCWILQTVELRERKVMKLNVLWF